jgi:lysosomal Pro-X carboxypeptidase
LTMAVLPAAFSLALLALVQPSASVDVKYTVHYADLPLDHFSFASNKTFKLRYLKNDTFWRAGGPILFYTGNEGDITMFAENTGFMWEALQDFKAMLVFAEHRYYGKSMPFGNASFSDPQHSGYLSSSQALADYVDLIYQIKKEYKVPPHAHPVIAIGGSYGGMLAAWIRMKYPGTIAGAIAASAPIWQFTGMVPCNSFNRITTSVYALTREQCALNIQKSWKALKNVSSTDKGKEWLTSTFKLCKPLKTESDVRELKEWLADVYTNLAMINYPYPSNFISEVPAHPVKVACQHLESRPNNDTELLSMIYNATTVYFNYTGSVKCLNVDTSATEKLGTAGWDYQSCTEMVMPMCSDGVRDMFEAQEWDLEGIKRECLKKFGVTPQPFLVEKLYGGKDLGSISNIIFSNGLLDPWSSGGVMFNVSSSTVAVVIPEGAHHLDLRFSNSADPLSVRKVRKLYKKMISHWIKEHRQIYPVV